MMASDIEAFLDGLVPLQLEREDIAGAIIVIVKNGNILFSKGYGYADMKGKVPVSPTATLFRPGSISKTFTWTAVMQLVERGKLDLYRDINDYLDFRVPHTFGRPVTLRNLMTHTAGFEEVIKDLVVDQASEMAPLRAFVAAHQPNQIFVPGTIPAYSNYGADLAGYIVERVSGCSFEDYVQENIFSPLGVTHATFVQPLPDSLKPMMSNGYELASGDAKPFELLPPQVAPDGSLAITGADIARFMIAHLENGIYGETRILQPQTTVSGPDQRNFDISIIKKMPVTETKSLEFRAEFFNAFNTPSFFSNSELNVGTVAADPTTGLPTWQPNPTGAQITSTSVAPRVIQFALKLYF